MKYGVLLRENLRISVNAVKSNKLRTVLTVFIIAFGIMALVGILTAIDAIKGSLENQFTIMGANTFTITNRQMVRRGGRGETSNPVISYRQAMEFSQEYDFPARVSVSYNASGTATVKYGSVKTNPNITVMGSDQFYLMNSGYELARGRNFSANEINTNAHVAIIGSHLAGELFEPGVQGEGKVITVGSGKYKVIGILREKGSGFGSGSDKICLLPLSNVRQYFARPNMHFRITALPNEPRLMDMAVSQARGLFRVIRGLRIRDPDNFTIETSDNLINLMMENLRYVTLAATIIGVITLFGASVGLMNIMLVSVTERTREIGVRKAIGAKSGLIRQQFLFESVFIGQMGGLLGIILGILVGNLVSAITGSAFIVPWVWIISGVLLCLVVGLLSGLLPAVKASQVDPITSLRYE